MGLTMRCSEPVGGVAVASMRPVRRVAELGSFAGLIHEPHRVSR